MSRKSSFKKPCKKPGCPGLTYYKYCEIHKHLETKEKQGKKRSPFYNSVRWKRLRKVKLLHNAICEECYKSGEVRDAKEVDHIIPHKGNAALFFNFNNLQSLCKSCHSKKTRREQNE